MKKLALLLFVFISLNSCWKEETPIKASERIGKTTTTIEMGSNYNQVIWYNIEDQSTYSLPKDAWEMLFNREGDEIIAFLNTGMFAQAAKSNTTDWSTAINTDLLEFHTDNSSLLTDSLAIGNHLTDGDIWILQRGYNALGQELPNIKIQCIAFDEQSITLKYGPIENTSFEQIDIELTAGSQGVGVRFTDDSILQVTPQEWDLCFTQYIFVFHEPFTPYLVTGVLTNTRGGTFSTLSEIAFESIESLLDVATPFDGDADNIGYDWKYYDLDAGQYTVDISKTYIVKTKENRFFKLRFLDFYNEQGERGFPKFEWEEIG